MAFDTRYIGEYQTEIWMDLKGSVALWTSAEITRCVERAVDDLSRFYPLEAVYEHTIVQTVTGEHWTADPTYGEFVLLDHKPIKPGSETVTDSAGNVCTRDTDYTMDYINGRIAHIGGGEIDNSEVDCHITYKKDVLGIDLSDIITNMIRVVRVEYPVDQVPQQFVSYNIWNDFMYIGSQKAGESQVQLMDKKHIAIYYEKPHTAPLAAAAPSYPAFLDEVICIGAAAYALLMMALKYEHQAVTDMTAVDTALGKVADEMINLEDIIGGADNVWEDEASILSDMSTALIAAGSSLSSGESKINTVNVGDNVPELYRDYANVEVAIAERHYLIARAWEQKRIDILTEVARYVDKADAWTAEAQGRIANASLYLEIAIRFRQEGLERRNEFWSILRDKAEYRKRVSSTPVKQPA